MNENLARMAQRGHRAIELHPDLGPQGIDLETAARDIIADILHALDDAALALDAQLVLDRALRCYRGDKFDNPDDGSDAAEDAAEARAERQREDEKDARA